jgi:hypothetical protein
MVCFGVGAPKLKSIDLRQAKPDSGCRDRSLEAIVLRGPSEIRNLSDRIFRVIASAQRLDDITVTPSYFLATCRETNSSPIVVAVFHDSELAGIVYGRGRTWFGLPTGVIQCGDVTGLGVGVAVPGLWEQVSLVAIRALQGLFGIHLVQFIWRADGAFGAKDLCRKLYRSFPGNRAVSLATRRRSESDVLRLAPSYAELLASLGRASRKNMRYYRNVAEKSGWHFLPNLGPAEVETAVRQLQHSAINHWPSPRHIRCYMRALAGADHVFFCGLANATGAWLSLMGGWAYGRKIFLYFQLNHRDHPRASVSTVLRSHLIEYAIQHNFEEIVVIGGCAGMLRRYCVSSEVEQVFVRRSSFTLLHLAASLLGVSSLWNRRTEEFVFEDPRLGPAQLTGRH